MPEPEAAAERDLAEVRDIVLRGLAGRGVQVFLFGSQAAGAAHTGSDIDVGVLADGPLPAALLSEVRVALEESHVPYIVDLVDLGAADPAFRDAVRREGVAWSA